LTEVISNFQKMNPNVQFDVLYVPFDDLRGKYETATGTGGGPTVLIGASDWGPASTMPSSLPTCLRWPGDAVAQDINNAALGAVRYKNAVIGLPRPSRAW